MKAKSKEKVIKQKFSLSLMWKQRYLLLMSVPFVIWLIVFKYIPLWGWSMAFQEVKPKSFALSFFEREFVGFDNYKTSWHYNLLEFIDNTYASVIKTKNNEYTLCGFSYGMQPSYTINADDTLGNPNYIEITLTDSHDVGDTLDFYDSVTYEYLSTKTWEYTKEHDGYECVTEGFAK